MNFRKEKKAIKNRLRYFIFLMIYCDILNPKNRKYIKLINLENVLK